MNVQRFVRWCETATARDRCEGVELLVRAYCEARASEGASDEARAALLLVLDDPSPNVRLALASSLCRLPDAPREIVIGLAEDINEIAIPVVERSPVLRQGDLIDLAAGGTSRLQAAIAGRPDVTPRLAAAIAEVGSLEACTALLANAEASIASLSLRRLAERHGDDAGLRALLLDRGDLPVDLRQTLILQLGQAFATMPLLSATMGQARAQRLVLDACERGTALLAAEVEPGEIPILVEHLRVSGQLSTAFLIRMVCSGHVDLFAAALVALSGRSERRVRAIVVDGREAAFNALIATCGLPPAASPLLRAAVQVWKQAIASPAGPNAADMPAKVMARLAELFRARSDEAGFEAVVQLLNRLETEFARNSARTAARRLAA